MEVLLRLRDLAGVAHQIAETLIRVTVLRIVLEHGQIHLLGFGLLLHNPQQVGVLEFNSGVVGIELHCVLQVFGCSVVIVAARGNRSAYTQELGSLRALRLNLVDLLFC